MRKPTELRGSIADADDVHEAADSRPKVQGAAACPSLCPPVMTAEVEPYFAMWLALADMLREREADARDLAIADAIEAATHGL